MCPFPLMLLPTVFTSRPVICHLAPCGIISTVESLAPKISPTQQPVLVSSTYRLLDSEQVTESLGVSVFLYVKWVHSSYALLHEQTPLVVYENNPFIMPWSSWGRD